jgi:hypothetical protein
MIEDKIRKREISERLLEYGLHKIFCIEDWEEVSFIPGETYFLRIYYIYNKFLGKAFLKSHTGEISLLDETKVIEKLKKIIRNKTRMMRRGVFVRRLSKIIGFTELFYLISIMDGKEVLGRGICMDEKSYRQRENDYVKNLFNHIITTR